LSTNKTIGERIKEKRKAERLSAQDLAIKLKLRKENIYKWERGSTPSNPEDYKKIMDWLNNLENVPRNTMPGKSGADLETGTVQEPEAIYGKKQELMEVLVQLMRTQNHILQRQEEDLVNRVRKMETNLDFVAGKAESLSFDLDSGRTTVLRSLARIEKRKETDELLNEADRLRESLAQAKAESYRNAATGK